MKNEKILETERLYLRELEKDDYDNLCEMLKDEKCMHAYKKTFSDDECKAWLGRHMGRYEKFGFGHWAVIEKETGNFLGQAGLILQDVEGEKELEIGYLFLRKHWGKGYAAEIAKAIKNYVFNEMGKDRLIALISTDNDASVRVAKKLGMSLEKEFDRDCYGNIIRHYVYAINREDL